MDKPKTGLEAVLAKVAEDAANLVKESALNELKSAVSAVRHLACLEKHDSDDMKAAKLRVAAAIKNTTEAGCLQEEIVSASSATVAPKQVTEGKEGNHSEAPQESAKDSAGGVSKEVLPKRVKPRDAARDAAIDAKETGKTPAEIAKAAAAAAKKAGGNARDIAKAALVAAKIAGITQGQREFTDSDSSSSSSSGSTSEEEEAEAPIEAKAKAAAKRDGIAAAFYFAAHSGAPPASAQPLRESA